MSENGPSPHKRIGEEFRAGSITAVGVVTGFTLTFLTTWASGPNAWELADLVALTPLLAGLLLQIWALALLLDPDSLILSHYRRATRIFLTGLIVTVSGAMLALFMDVVPEVAAR